MAGNKGKRIVCVNNGGKPCSHGCDEFHACPYKSRPVANATPPQAKDTEIERLQKRVQELQGLLTSGVHIVEQLVGVGVLPTVYASMLNPTGQWLLKSQTALKEDQ